MAFSPSRLKRTANKGVGLGGGFELLHAGEAQKIDRIMEKFAERYCRDNEGAFASADGPYLLAFALIMLNTDAHNPRAEKKLSCEDFVTMCQAQVGLERQC